MTYALIQTGPTSSVPVSNTVLAQDLDTFDVDNDVLEGDTTAHTIFAATVPLSPGDKSGYDPDINQSLNLSTAVVIFPSRDTQRSKRIGSVKDFVVDCSEELELMNPNDAIASVVVALEQGDITLGTPYVDGTTRAVCRISGGTKLYHWNNVRFTITCVSGQILTPLVPIRLTK
jgi:hypothetical protein